jgi:hypothetical protein
MLKAASLYITGCLLVALSLSGCSTNIRAFPVVAGQPRQGGIPFFAPKPVIQVREPIEVSRAETLFALIDIGGMEKLLYELKQSSIDKAIEELKKLLDSQQIELAERETVPFYVKEESTKEKVQTDQNKLKERESSKKYEVTSDNETKSELKPLYKPADVEKALSVVWVPDTNKEYELLIDPSMFASSELSIKLTDGWRFDSITAKTGENQLIKELASLLQTVVGAQKEVKVAEITKEQALKLKEMELAASKPEEETKSLLRGKKPRIRVIGYMRRTTIKTLLPGIYELRFSNGSLTIPQQSTEVWERIRL